MKLTRNAGCYLINGFFSKAVISGFTAPAVVGKLPEVIEPTFKFISGNYKASFLNQMHSKIIHAVEEPGVYDGDALFTKSIGHLLIVKTADCLPLIFESQELGVVGVVHMGWRSAAKKIMDNIPYELKTFKVFAGVGMRQCCFEVGEELLKLEHFKKFIIQKDENKVFNPVGFAYESLFSKGLRRENFFDVNICSVCSHLKFFSHRRNKTENRTFSFIIKVS